VALVFSPALFFAGFSRGGLCARPGMFFVLRAPGIEVFRLGLSQRFVPFSRYRSWAVPELAVSISAWRSGF